MSTKHTFECNNCERKFNKIYQLMKHNREEHKFTSFYGDRHSKESIQQEVDNAATTRMTSVAKKKAKALNNLVNGPFYKS